MEEKRKEEPETGIEEKKRELRKAIRERAAALSLETFQLAGKLIEEQIQNLPAYANAKVVFCFVSTAHEPETRGLLQQLFADGKQVAVPRCGKGGQMDACLIQSLDELVPGRFGIFAPGETAERIAPEKLDLILLPALSCGLDGNRLGQGGGFYDRFLPRTKAVRAALCREAELQEKIPAKKHDCKMDYVITEHACIRVPV